MACITNDEIKALFYEFERMAVLSGNANELPDSTAFGYTAATYSLLKAIDLVSDEDLFPILTLPDGTCEDVTKIDIWRFRNREYFNRLWNGSIWSCNPRNPEWKQSYLQPPYAEKTFGCGYRVSNYEYLEEDNPNQHDHMLTTLEDWPNNSFFTSEFGDMIYGLMHYQGKHERFGDESYLRWTAWHLSSILFLCKEVLRKFPEYADVLRKVAFYAEGHLDQFRENVAQAVSKVYRY